MLDNMENLRSICSALMASDFSILDRLKSILQVAYEILNASSIVAYKFDRVSGGLDILAMPGVREREIMRGPTPEPIFVWEGLTSSVSEEDMGAIWLENTQKYHEHIERLHFLHPIPKRPEGHKDFRSRELEKYGGRGDMAMAKLCLYKGIGQTNDRVGQLFFNFHKESSNEKTFTSGMKSAVCYIATVVRELLVQELYHQHEPAKETGLATYDTVHLLRTLNENIMARVLAGVAPAESLPSDARGILKALLKQKKSLVEAQISQIINRNVEVVAQLPVLKDKCHRIDLLSGFLKKSGKLPRDEQLQTDFRELLDEALSLEMCRCMCRTALACVETFGGQADIIRVIAGRIGIRVAPLDPVALDKPDIFLLDEESITGHCLATEKVFVCNNITEKGSPIFRARFTKEYRVSEYKSLMVVPIGTERNSASVLRMMSSDKDCFLDRHTRAVQYNAFAGGHAFRLLDSRRMRERISHGLSFFAQGQAVAPQSCIEDLLREALRVLSGDYVIFWEAHKSNHSTRVFEGGLYVPASKTLKAIELDKRAVETETREDGLTRRIYDCAVTAEGLIVSIHILAELQSSNNAFPEYIFQVFSHKENSGNTGADEPEYEGAFPSCDLPLKGFPYGRDGVGLSSNTVRQPHSQVGFAIKDRASGGVYGVAWIGFTNIHELSWWEKLYIRGMSNYLAQTLSARGLRLALRSFVHMIPKSSADAKATLELAEFGVKNNHENTILELRSAAATAMDMLYMTERKSREVTRLLKPEDRSINLIGDTLSETLRHAWAIATSLGTTSNNFNRELGTVFCTETAGPCCFIYPDKSIPDQNVGGIVYTVAINIMKNSIDYGKQPYRTWVSSWGKRDHIIIFANGGDPPSSDALQVPECAIRLEDENKVGLPLVKRFLSLEGGEIRLLSRADFDYKYPNCPKNLCDCKTFYEVIFKEAM